MKDIYCAVHNGFVFSLEGPETAPTEADLDALPLFNSPFMIILNFFTQAGTVIAECCVATHMCYPEWLLVDVVCITGSSSEGFQRFLMFTVPRLSYFGMLGISFDTFYIAAPAVTGLPILILYIA